MAGAKQANDNGGRPAEYTLGDLEIVSNGRPSGERLVSQRAQPSEPRSPQSSTRHAPPRTLTLDDDDTGPALELDVAPLPAPRRGSAPPPARPAPSGARGASAVGVAHTSQGGAVLALSSFADSITDDFEDGGFANLPAIEVEQVATRSAERVSIRESAPEDPRVKERNEAQRVADLADFGDVPKGLIASVGYAVRVLRRVLKLRVERAVVQSDVEQRAEAHHTALVTMGRRLMALGDRRLEPLHNQVARVLAERGKAEQASESVEKTRGEGQRSLEQLRAKLVEQEHKLAPFQQAERTALAAQRKADEELRRAQAMHKRAEIELRALGEASTSDPSRVDALAAQLAQRATAIADLTAALTHANEGLGRSRRELALERGALDVLLEQQRQLEGAARARESEAEGQRKAADGALDLALRELADAARAQKLSPLVAEAERDVQGCEAALQEAGETLVRFDRALALYDRGAVTKGAGLTAALLLAALALLIAR